MRLLPPPGSLPEEGWTTAAVLALMECWWLTEAVPIAVTALLPLVFFPTLGLAGMQEAATPYANELIFLFMGGFFLAAAMEKWEVHRRIALAILARVGTSPGRVLLGFMTATAFISMWINNTATTAMMLPIALAVGTMFRPPYDPGADPRPYNFGIALMLGIAYASSIGGVATLIGTAPNALFAAAASELVGVEIGFLEWMLVGIPVSWIMLPLTWLVLTRVYPPGTLRGDVGVLMQQERASMGPMSPGERFVSVVFGLTVLAWVMRAPKELGALTIPGISTWLPGVTDGTIAMIAGITLMAVPYDLRRGRFALDWVTASRIPWGVLLLFGCGLSLAAAMSDTGLASWIGGGVANLAGFPLLVMILAVATLFIFLTEVTSNTAVTAMAMPVLAGVALTLGIPPVYLMATAAIACSMAFMLPAGTPPNAIVFSSGYITVAQMAWAGIWINLLAITVVTAAGVLLVPLVFGP
jgi:sodium-dependent dicarboxylate transporter 2/3/5